MSWRTQGKYGGLAASDLEWLRSFDREWDTKAYGRGSQSDVLDQATCIRLDMRAPRLADIAPVSSDAEELEVRLTEVSGRIDKFTVPKRRHFGWVIQLVLTNGKRCHARYTHKSDALQAYLMLQELYVSILMT